MLNPLLVGCDFVLLDRFVIMNTIRSQTISY